MRLFNAGLNSSLNRPVIVKRPMPGGLSLLEVLIVMGIIGTLIAMLLPAIAAHGLQRGNLSAQINCVSLASQT